MPKLPAGALRHKIQVLAPVNGSPDSYGAPTGGFASLGTRRASIEPLTGRELWAARQISADVTHKITLRYYSGILPSWQFARLNGAGNVVQTFAISYILDKDEVHQYMTCMAKEVPTATTSSPFGSLLGGYFGGYFGS